MAHTSANPGAGDTGARQSSSTTPLKVAAANSQTKNQTQASSWRDVLPVHPAAAMFPLLSETDPVALKALGEDIRKNGLTSPIVLYGDQPSLLDGRNRLDAMEAVGISLVCESGRFDRAALGGACVNDVIRRVVEGDPYEYVVSANLHRRHLTAKQKRQIVADLLKANPARSNNATAKLAKVDDKTVASVRTELETRSEIPNAKNRTDTTGRPQPARKPRAGTNVPPAATPAEAAPPVDAPSWAHCCEPGIALERRRARHSWRASDCRKCPRCRLLLIRATCRRSCAGLRHEGRRPACHGSEVLAVGLNDRHQRTCSSPAFHGESEDRVK
jgi:hypothetical protein